MKFGGLEQVTWPQYEVALHDLSMSGDDEVLEELGYIRSDETLKRHVACGAEVADVLGIDMRTPTEIRRQEAREYYDEEFFLSGVASLSAAQQERNASGLRAARSALEERRAS